MTDKENLRIDILSSISEEFVDEVTEARIAAKRMVAKRRRTFTASVSAAAVVLILFATFIPMFFGLLTGTVPTYTGMTVSKSSPFDGLQSAARDSSAELCSVTLTSEIKASAHKGKPIKNGIKEYFNVSSDSSIYYAKPGEDIYITVKFDNPDDYEILSFTLNGKKYTAYMFEEGSDMENIVLKVNVGDKSGLLNYTIDAIKYVDGEKIKDARIGGDRTVSVGVYNDNQPTADIGEMSYGERGVSFNADVSDPEGLIGATDGKLYALIYDGDTVVAYREISIGETDEISFNDLVPKTDYCAAIVAIFDAYDGEGVSPHVLSEAHFTTRITALATNVTVDGDTVAFDIHYSSESVSVSKIELVDARGIVVKESDAPVSEFESIPGGRLSIRVTFSYEIDGVTHTDTSSTPFVCTKGMLPIIGDISAHYDGGILTYPDGALHTGHHGVDLIPTTENKEVYSITDGVITDIVNVLSLPDELRYICGKIEIRDKDGVYHYYKFVDSSAVGLSVGDEVKAGDLLGVICEMRENDLTLQDHLHYETYVLDGDVKKYRIPSFDNEPREISEQERMERIALSEEMLTSDVLSIEGESGGTATYTTSFDFTYSDESVSLYVIGDSELVRLERRDDGQWSIICDLEGVTEPFEVMLGYNVHVGHGSTSYRDHITLRIKPTT